MSTLEFIATPSDSLTTKLENRTAKIGVIGLGYVGLPLVLLFSEQDFRITGFDVDAKKVDIIKRGGSYIVRIPETEIQAAKSKGFTATRIIPIFPTWTRSSSACRLRWMITMSPT